MGSKTDDTNEDRWKQIEEELRRQIWPKHLIINGEKFSRVEDVEKLQLPDVSDEDIIKNS